MSDTDTQSVEELDPDYDGNDYVDPPAEEVIAEIAKVMKTKPDWQIEWGMAYDTSPEVWHSLDERTQTWLVDHVRWNDLRPATYELVHQAHVRREAEEQAKKDRDEAERERLEAERERLEAERAARYAAEREEKLAEAHRRIEFNDLLRHATGVPDRRSRPDSSRLQPLVVDHDDGFEFGGPDDPGAPSLLRRTDGPALIYPGLTHSIAGESESGKTWLALWMAKEFIETTTPWSPSVARGVGFSGPCVGYLDFERNASQYQERLPALGIASDRFWYTTPHLSADSTDPDFDLRTLLNGRFLRDPYSDGQTRDWISPVGLVIIDDVSQAMSSMGYGESNAAVTLWQNQLPNRLAARGITVVMLDHLVKANDGTGRYPLGGVMKLNGVTGAQYIVTATKPIGAGLIGETEIRVGKDRPGRVRQVAADWRDYDKTARVGRLIHDAVDPRHVVMRIEPPTSASKRQRDDLELRVMAYLTTRPGTGFRELKSTLKTGTPTLNKALARLLSDHQIREEKGPRNARLFSPL